MSTHAQAHQGNLKFASAGLDPGGQNIERLQLVLAEMLKRGGCTGCGRIAFLGVEFYSDPPESLVKLGVNSLIEQGLNVR